MNECREELLGGGKEGRKEGAITISEREMGAPSSPRVPPACLASPCKKRLSVTWSVARKRRATERMSEGTKGGREGGKEGKEEGRRPREGMSERKVTMYKQAQGKTLKGGRGRIGE